MLVGSRWGLVRNIYGIADFHAYKKLLSLFLLTQHETQEACDRKSFIISK